MELRAREARRGRQDAAARCSGGLRYSRISPNLKRAVLVAEDAAFWDHDGVDYDELQKSIEAGLGARASSCAARARSRSSSPRTSICRRRGIRCASCAS